MGLFALDWRARDHAILGVCLLRALVLGFTVSLEFSRTLDFRA